MRRTTPAPPPQATRARSSPAGAARGAARRRGVQPGGPADPGARDPGRRHRGRQGRPARPGRAGHLAAHRRADPRGRRPPGARREDREPAARCGRRPAWTPPTSSGSRSSRAGSPGSSRSTTRRSRRRSGPIRSVRPMDPAIAAPLARGDRLLRRPAGLRRRARRLRAAGRQPRRGRRRVLPPLGPRGAAQRVRRPGPFLAQADAAHAAPPAPQFRIARRPDLATATTTGDARRRSVLLTMSRARQPAWTWDAASSTWLRSESGRPATAASGARLAAANVVVLRVDLVDSGHAGPGRRGRPGDAARRRRAPRPWRPAAGRSTSPGPRSPSTRRCS